MALISIVIRVENQGEILRELASRLGKVAADTTRHNFEFVYIDQGSRDSSYRILQELASADRRVRVVRLSRNFGTTAGVLAGISFASGGCVGVIKGDLSEPPEALGDMIAHWEAGSKVIRALPEDEEMLSGELPGIGRFLAQLNHALRFLYGPRGAREYFLFDHLVAEALLQAHAPEDSIAGFISWTGFRPDLVRYSPSLARRSGAGAHAGGLNRSGATGASSVTRSFLRIFARFAILLAFLEALLIGGIVFTGLRNGADISDFPEIYPVWKLVALALIMASPVQLTILGLIGEFLRKAQAPSRSRPAFIVETVINEPLPNPEAREKIERILATLSASAHRRQSGGISRPA
jgi:dolichol-phosphate mannosyltransferase